MPPPISNIIKDSNFFIDAYNFAKGALNSAVLYIVDAVLSRDFLALIPFEISLVVLVTIPLVLLVRKSKKSSPRPNVKATAVSGAAAASKPATLLSSRLFVDDSVLSRGEDESFAMLQNYLGEANTAVRKTGGMISVAADGSFNAAWGLNSDTGDVAHDALNAIRAALLLRMRLLEYNKPRRTPVFQISGISTGKLALTGAGSGAGSGAGARALLVGEPSILALNAREAAIKFGADIVITAKTWRLIEDYIIAEEIDPLYRDDRAIRMFALINLRVKKGAVQSRPENLDELRTLLRRGYMRNTGANYDTSQ
jgi:hypothetical protein